METPIVLNSVDAGAGSKSHDFTINFIPQIILDKNKRHYVMLDSLSMAYSWHNINTQFSNNTIHYSHDSGVTYTTITIRDGVYSYASLNSYITAQIAANGHSISTSDAGVELTFITSEYKVYIRLGATYRIDLSVGLFADLIGFNKDIVSASQYGVRLPNITNSIDDIQVRCSLISDSIVSGIASDVLYSFSTASEQISYNFKKEPIRRIYNLINTDTISSIRIYFTDNLNRPVNLNNIPVSLRLLLKDE